MQETDPDAQLMLAFSAGDDSAFEGLFGRWAGPLLRYLERMVGDAATAEELVQETFFRVHRARGRYEARARFSTWLYRIATNLALNELKRPRRRHLHAAEDDVASELRSGLAPPDELADVRRRSAAMEEELTRLPERQRMALWLSAAEGRSYAEVAAILETSEQSVKALVHRGRVALVKRAQAENAVAEARVDQAAATNAAMQVRQDVQKKDAQKDEKVLARSGEAGSESSLAGRKVDARRTR